MQRLEGFQVKDGLFAIWCGGEPGLEITARVAHRLGAYRSLDYSAATQMRNRAVRALLQAGYRDNQLLALDPGFQDRLATVKDAVALYFHGRDQRDQALGLLRREAIRDNGHVRWPGKAAWGYWGGDLEATCDAARVMYDAGDPLFRPAFNYVGSKVIAGGLYSTADTRALVELLAAMRLAGKPVARIDGSEVQGDRRRSPGQETVGQEVTALQDNLMVRVDEEVVIDHLAPAANFAFSVSVEPQALKLGQRAQVTVRLQEDSICPLARLYLPGCLALLKAGANAQTAHLPVGVDGLIFRGNSRLLQVDAVAVRKGQGQVRVAVHDLYDAQKIGVAPGVPVQVG